MPLIAELVPEGLREHLTTTRAALAADLREHGADALVATREGLVAYLTGYTTRTWSNFSRPIVAVLFADGSVTVICADTEGDAIERRCPDTGVAPYGGLEPPPAGVSLPDGRVQFSPPAIRVLGDLLASRGVATVAVDGLGAVHPPVSQFGTRGAGWDGPVIDASAFVWRRRLRKSAWEVERLRAAAGVLERAFARFPQTIAPGMTERQIHGQLAAAAFLEGADEIGYTNVVAGIDRGMFGAPTDKPWEAGEVVYVDGGVVVDGYWADFCRFYVAGRATASQREGYARVIAALETGVAAFREGAVAGDIGAALQEATGTPAGSHEFGRYGHGIGLYMPEPPSLHPLDDTLMDEGVVVCVEPAVIHDGSNYVAEEEYVVSASGPVRISPEMPRELFEV